MHPAYSLVRFRCAAPAQWPREFAILTACATTGEVWTAEREQAAQDALRGTLERCGVWHHVVTGYFPPDGHAEQGWAVELPLDAACDLGARFLQDAIYWVHRDALSVTHCDDARRGLVALGGFRERMDAHA